MSAEVHANRKVHTSKVAGDEVGEQGVPDHVDAPQRGGGSSERDRRTADRSTSFSHLPKTSLRRKVVILQQVVGLHSAGEASADDGGQLIGRYARAGPFDGQVSLRNHSTGGH